MQLIYRNQNGREIPHDVELVPRGGHLEIMDTELNMPLAMIAPTERTKFLEGQPVSLGHGEMQLMLH